jgi:uncharacterized membrane protein YfcA
VSIAFGAIAVGCSIGLLGIGGVFLIPLLVAANYPLDTAIGTALCAFIVTGVVSTIIFARRGVIDWHGAAWTSIGSVVGGPIGARVEAWLPQRAVAGTFAAMLIAVGILALVRREPADGSARVGRISPAILVPSGLVVGIGSGLTGIGGPALLVPLLLLLRVPAGAAVALSQPNQIAASAGGALGHVLFGHVDGTLAVTLCITAGAGAALGAAVHGRVPAQMLRRLVGAACIVLGSWLVRGWLAA